MQAVMLDKGSLDNNDLDFSELERLPIEWVYFHNTRPEEVRQRIQEADIVVTNKVNLTAQVLEKINCKLICVAATGTNNIAIKAAQNNNIPVCNVRAYATPAVVQHTFMLIMALSGNLLAYRESLQAGQWQQSDFFTFFTHPITELAGKTLGIIGYGELGRAVDKLGQALGMNVLVAKSFIGDTSVSRVSLDRLFAESDIVSLHCPLTQETFEIINKKSLDQMKSTALLINTARGELVNESALLDALSNNKIAGAGLDVINQEPPETGNKLLSLNIPNLIITPHIAWATREARQRLLDQLVLNIKSFLDGEIRNQV